MSWNEYGGPAGKQGLRSDQGAGPVTIYRPKDGKHPDEHQAAATAAKVEEQEANVKTCTQCGKQYKPRGNSQRFCGDACKAAAKGKAPPKGEAPPPQSEKRPRTPRPDRGHPATALGQADALRVQARKFREAADALERAA